MNPRTEQLTADAGERNPADLIRLERVRMVARQMATSVGGTMIVIVLLTVVMWPYLDHRLALACCGVMTVNQTWRFGMYLHFLRYGLTVAEVDSFARRWFIGSGISGLVWSAIAFGYFVPEVPIMQTLLIISIFGATAVAIPLTAAHQPSFRIFAIPIMLSLTGRILWQGDPLHLILGLLVFVEMIANLTVGRRYHVMLGESLRGRFENEALADRLFRQNAELEKARNTAEEANRAKTRFFAAASHDLRQPLHAIGLFADLLASRLKEGESARLANNINASVAMLEALFSELLNISRIDAGVVQPEPADFDLDPLLSRLCRDFEAETLNKGLQLRLRSEDVTVHSDPYLVERILRNLISNAIRYTQEGGVLVSCRRHGNVAWVEVWDTGVGIAPEQQESVFEEFHQLGNPERDLSKGMGLGLAIVKRLTEVLHLPLSMRSLPGRGTRFRLALPSVDRQAASAADPPASGTIGSFAGRRILLIDDEENVRRGMTTLLEGWGAEVVACRNLAAAEAATAGLLQAPDLIVSNYILADGTEGARIVAALRSQFHSPIPAIVLAGAITPERAA
ncbi:MAG TPA: hybrid sensor histidine kinase/response regulator, partial [Rhodocyclaceae bacterium]|nr:hybrid sensor histidine kinase/response regulator [Rhodocyclaceae bacterium]